MRALKNWSRKTVTTAAVALCLIGAAEARQLSYGTGFPAGTDGVKALEYHADAVERYSDGDLTIKVYPMSLLSFPEAVSGVRDGLADMSTAFFPYFPAEFPSANLAGEISMLLELADVPADKAGIAYAGAMSEYVFSQCPECLEEFRKQNHVNLGVASSAPYYLMCNEPITRVEQLKGKRVRSSGGQWSRWVEAMGANPTSVTVSDTYEALDQGVLDCDVGGLHNLSSFKTAEVVSDLIIGIPGGVFATAGSQINADTWASLDTEQRTALLRASADLAAQFSWMYAAAAARDLAAAEQSEDKRVHQASAELRQATAEFIRQDLKNIARSYSERYGLSNAEESIETFGATLDRWVKLVDGVDSAEALADLYWREAFSKVDVNRYGL